MVMKTDKLIALINFPGNEERYADPSSLCFQPVNSKYYTVF